jgi:hypothetical protein
LKKELKPITPKVRGVEKYGPWPMTRDDAKRLGSKYYLKDEPCTRGHHVPRRTSDAHCPACDNENAAKYMREDPEKAQANRDRAKQYRRENPERRRVSSREQARRSRRQNPEKSRAADKKWRDANPEKAAASHAKWRAENPEKVKEHNRTWPKLNPDKKRSKDHRRRAQKLQSGESFSASDIREILAAQKHKCAYCSKSIRKKYHIDHITPLAKGGSNGRKNIQLTCVDCNLEKWSHDPLVFARKKGLIC